MDQKVDATAKPGSLPPREAPAAAQADSRVQMVMTQSKLRAERTEQLPVHEEGVMARSICLDLKTRWPSGVKKAAEMEIRFVPPRVAVTRGNKWKAQRAADCGPGSWGYPRGVDIPPADAGPAKGISVVEGVQAQAVPQVVGLPLGYMMVRDDREPPPLKAMFDRWLEKLAYFLNQVWNYLRRYGAMYPDEVDRVNTITLNLEDKVADWVLYLHNERAPELGNVDAFLEEF